MSSKNAKHYLAGKRIIVSGAGIGGLTFSIAFETELALQQKRPVESNC